MNLNEIAQQLKVFEGHEAKSVDPQKTQTLVAKPLVIILPYLERNKKSQQQTQQVCRCHVREHKDALQSCWKDQHVRKKGSGNDFLNSGRVCTHRNTWCFNTHLAVATPLCLCGLSPSTQTGLLMSPAANGTARRRNQVGFWGLFVCF